MAEMVFLSVRIRQGDRDELYEIDAGVPTLYQAADVLRALAQSVGEHAEAREHDAAATADRDGQG